MSVCRIVVVFFLAFLRDRSDLAAQNVALRQQLAVLQRSGRRLKLRKCDRIFWVWLSKLWPNWRSALLLAKPDTVADCTGKGSSCTGAGSPGTRRRGDRRWHGRSAA